MKGLVLKDLMLIKKMLKQFLVVLLVCSGYSFVLEGNSMLMLCVVFIPFCVFNAFYHDDAVNWNKYALTMNISVKNLVGSRYVLLFLLSFGGFAATVISNIIVSLLVNKNLNGLGEDVIIYAFLILLVNLVFSVAIYFNFKNGTEKSQIVMLVSCFLLALGFSVPLILSQEQIFAVTWYIENNYIPLAILLVIFAILCMYTSFLKSVLVIKNKEL